MCSSRAGLPCPTAAGLCAGRAARVTRAQAQCHRPSAPIQCGGPMGGKGRHHLVGEASWAGEHGEQFCHRPFTPCTPPPPPGGPGRSVGPQGASLGTPCSPWASGHLSITTSMAGLLSSQAPVVSIFAKSCGSAGSLPCFRVEVGKGTGPAAPSRSSFKWILSRLMRTWSTSRGTAQAWLR